MEVEDSYCPSLSVELFAEKMILEAKAKLGETKELFPDRPIYLIGWGPGKKEI